MEEKKGSNILYFLSRTPHMLLHAALLLLMNRTS
jgi:hypothetical protein